MHERIKEHDWDIRLSRTQTSAVSNKTRDYPFWDKVKFIDRILLKGDHTTFLVQFGLNCFALVCSPKTSNYHTFWKTYSCKLIPNSKLTLKSYDYLYNFLQTCAVEVNKIWQEKKLEQSNFATKKHHKIHVHYEMEAYLGTSGKNGTIYSTCCKCFVGYLIYHLPVSLKFLKN